MLIKKILSKPSSCAAQTSRNYFIGYSSLLFLLLLLGVFFSGCKKDNYDGEITGLCPLVSTDPVNEAKDVAVSKVIMLTFNTSMNPSTINNTTVSLKQGAVNIAGMTNPTADGKIFTFTPATPLAPFTTYTGTVTTGARDTLRTAMAADYVWTFTTAPRISISSNPIAGGTVTGAGDFNQGSVVNIAAMPNTGYAFTNWTKAGVVVSTNLNYQFNMAGNADLVANFIPSGNYTVGISSNPATGGTTSGAGIYTPGTAVQIRAVPASGYTFTGWSGDASGTTNPLTFSINSHKNITANFASGGPVIGAGNGPVLPGLGAAATFSILTKSGISTTGVTLINGDIGVSPATATSITGFGLIMDSSGEFARSPIVTGRIYAANYAAPTPSNTSTAGINMETAYTTANGLVSPAPVIAAGAGNISGLTLAPGLYKWSTGVIIDPNTTLTLSGGANDTWVFQIAQDLTVSNSAKVILLGGAQAKNIMWVVAGQATLGTQTYFSGTILSKTLISLNNGSIVTGRLLAQTAVTLIGSTVIQP